MQIVPLSSPPISATKDTKRHQSLLSSSAFAVSCSPTIFRFVWVTILVFHFGNAAVILRAIYSFIRTANDPTQTTTVLRNVGVAYYPIGMIGGSMFGLIAASMHIFHVLRAIYQSIRSGTLVFHQYSTAQDNHAVLQHDTKWYMRCWRIIRLSWRCLVDGFSVWGIRGVYFDEGFLIRELIEIGIQTYQAYRISYLVPQGWVSQLAVCVVVLNCWTTPLLHFAFVFFASNYDRHEPLRRVLCLATDIVLDFFSSMIIPFLIYSSYRSQILKNQWHDPMWVLRVGNDLLCFYLSNIWDVGFRLLPNFSMLTCLGAIQPLFRPRGIPRSHPSFRNQFQVRRSHQPSSRLWVVHGFLAVYGFAILIISSAAYRKVHQFSLVGCHSTTRSWFATKYPCAVLELNCFRHNWTGSANELDSMLELADDRTIAAVVITHCRQLEMPSRIQKFKNLVWLEIYNSTIVQWHDDAALSSFHHQRISRLMLIHVNVSMFPTRALADEFPPTLIDLEFVHTNLSLVFPSAPGRSWPSSIYRLYLEHCGLVETPPVLTSFRVATLSLAGNAIQSFPSTLVNSRHYRQLSLAQNPIQSLPNAVWAVKTLHLEGTLISSLPPSLANSSTTTTILATQTPLCSTPPSISQLDCALTRQDGALFPLELYQVGRPP